MRSNKCISKKAVAQIVLLFILCTTGTIESKTLRNKYKSSLRLVQIIFRHGDRTPTFNSRYPNDPYLNETYPPYGSGQLTEAGKRHSFILGQQIRSRYDTLLGSEYFYGLINSTSTHPTRTQMTLACVHAGLFSSEFEDLNENDFKLELQPMSYEVIPAKSDNLLYINCPTIYEVPRDAFMSRKTRHLYEYTAFWTGHNPSTMGPTEILKVYDSILVESQMGKAIPMWAEVIFPEPIRTEALKTWDFYNKYKLRLSLGLFMKRVNTINQQKSTSTLEPSTLKMFLYSCHDLNIATWLGMLNQRVVKPIEYNAHVFVELHEIDNQYTVQVFFKNGINGVLKPMKLENCDYNCPLEEFVQNTEWLYNPTPTCD